MTDVHHDVSFLVGGGELGERMRSFDWSNTELGPPAHWPQSLKTALRIMLSSRQPFWLGWGAKLIYFYNDSYKSIIGGKHPWALGKPFAEVWREIFNVVGPLADKVIRDNEGIYCESQLLIMERHGYQEETYCTFSYSPVPDASGRPGGLICANTDDTQRVIGERQMTTLRELAARTTEANTWQDACALSAEALAMNARDLPFAMIYMLDDDEKQLRLASSVRIERGSKAAPESIALDSDTSWPVREALRGTQPVHVSVDSAFGELPMGDWDKSPTQVALLPITPSVGRPGVLIVGLNPYRLFDARYQGFLRWVAGQIAANIANAQAFEEEKKRAEALAEIDRAKTAFLTNVSHEFRTPLTLMLGPLDFLLSDAKGGLTNDAIEALNTAYRNSLRLLKLVNTLLDFSCIEAGRMQASFEPVDLCTVTRDLAGVFHKAAERAGLTLRVECAPLPQPVFIDRDMWKKIVLNLLSNAFKFTFEGEIEVKLESVANHARLTVRDTGVGIPAGELAHIFDRFHRVEHRRGRTHEGSRIGLALVKELTKLHGGTVEVHSDVDRGSAFSVILPFGRAHLEGKRIGEPEQVPATAIRPAAFVEETLSWMPRPSAEESPSPRQRRARILWADDNADMRAYVTRLLGEHYQVESVTDGQAALDAARARTPDLIVTDVLMPRLDGFGLIREVRADPHLKHVPVIALSAHAGDEARLAGVGLNADDYLLKPFSARELLVRVTTLLERKHAERIVRESEARFRNMADHAPVMIWITETDGRCAYLSASWYEFTGQRPDTGLGFGWMSAVHPNDQTHAHDTFLAANGQHEAFRLEYRLRRHDGQYRWAIDSAKPRFDDNGQFLGYIGSVVDITERKAMEEALRASETRYRQIFQGASVSIWEQDFSILKAAIDDLRRNDVHDFRRYIAEHPEFVQRAMRLVRLVDVNDASLRLFEANSKDELLASVERTLTPETAKVFEEELIAIAEQRTLFEANATVCTLTGRRFHAMVSIAFPERADNFDRVLVSLMDITNMVEAEQAVREADRRKDEFLAMLSHELRNPLAPIRNAAAILRSASADRDTVRKMSTLLDRQVAQLARLVDDLLDVARVTQGRITLSKETVPVMTVVERAADTIRSSLANKKQQVEIVDSEQPLYIYADEARMQQIVGNLLDNASKYSPERSIIRVYIEQQGEQAAIRVRDHGIGIEPTLLPHVFDLFVQADRSLDRAQGGLGIGLNVVKRLVEMHDGSVEAQSAGVGKGSEFIVRLPLAKAPRPLNARNVGESKGAQRRRVLLVEDNRDTAESLALLLEMSGHKVEVTHDGNAALKRLNEFNADCMLIDIGLPGMDGYTLARAVRKRRAELTLYALTGYGQDADRQLALDAGFDDHLTKPVDVDRLLALIGRRVGARKALH